MHRKHAIAADGHRQRAPLADERGVATRDRAFRYAPKIALAKLISASRRLLARSADRTTPGAARIVARRTMGGAMVSARGAGRLVLIQRYVERPIPGSALARRKYTPAKPLLETRKATSWIKFQVVHHATGEPFVGVRLAVRLPTGLEVSVRTDSGGLATLDEIDPGTCNIWCPLKGARLVHTVAFVGMGKPPPRQASKAVAPVRSDWGAAAEWIANIDEHHVQTGESLKSVAERYAYSWQELAEFNWGTRVPDEINQRLRDDVGCTVKTPDGFNYRFTSQDEPGLIYIPRSWSESGLATEQTHVIRVRLAAGFRLILENQDRLRIPEADYEASLSDGTVRKGRLGRSGVALIKDPPPGPIEVQYPDLDDIQAKSLAACARQAMNDRNMEEVFRVMKHSRWMLRRLIAAYDRYYNDYTGGGLLADIDQEATDEQDRSNMRAVLWIGALREDEAGGGAHATETASTEAP